MTVAALEEKSGTKIQACGGWRELPDILTCDLLSPAHDILRRPLHNREQGAVTDGTIRTIEHEIIRHSRRADTEIRLGIARPLLLERAAVGASQLEVRLEGDVEARCGDDDVDFLDALGRLDARLRDPQDRVEVALGVGLLDGLEVAVAGGEAAAAYLPVGD